MELHALIKPAAFADGERTLVQGALQFAKYTAASALALSLDYTVYWSLVKQLGFEISTAASVGYLCGLAVTYGLMSRKVFSPGWLSGRRTVEAVLFALSGLLGLCLTFATALLVDRWLGAGLHQAKLAAIFVSFFSVYLFRRFVVFRPPSRNGGPSDR